MEWILDMMESSDKVLIVTDTQSSQSLKEMLSVFENRISRDSYVTHDEEKDGGFIEFLDKTDKDKRVISKSINVWLRSTKGSKDTFRKDIKYILPYLKSLALGTTINISPSYIEYE